MAKQTAGASFAIVGPSFLFLLQFLVLCVNLDLIYHAGSFRFYDMNNGTIPVKLADKIHKRKEQARKLYERKQELEMLSQKTTATECGPEDLLSPSVESQTFDLMQIHLQLNPLLMELQLLENPTMRFVWMNVLCCLFISLCLTPFILNFQECSCKEIS